MLSEKKTDSKLRVIYLVNQQKLLMSYFYMEGVKILELAQFSWVVEFCKERTNIVDGMGLRNKNGNVGGIF